MKFTADSVKYIVLTSITTLLFFCAHSQSLRQHLQQGDRYFQRKDYKNALEGYLNALALDENNARVCFKAGICCLREARYDEAITYLEKALRLEPDIDPQIDYQLATAYQENHAFAKAREHYEAFGRKYKNLSGVANQKIRECTLADSLMRLPSSAAVSALDEVNTSFAETLPILANDGKTLLFTSNRSSDDYEIKSGTNYNDVYIAQKAGDAWGAPEKIGPAVNVKPNNAAVSLSQDGKTLFLYYEEGEGDIYTTSLENGSWTAPIALNRFVNHPRYRDVSACVSPDNKKLYFSSNRPGGRGGYDLYVCDRTANGDWGRPSNLGPTINTPGDEVSPFLHADGISLYFSSNGHATIGDHDIYKSTLRGEKWTTPEHLGYPINTRGYEGDFILSEDGKTGYFSSRRELATGIDIYRATFTP